MFFTISAGSFSPIITNQPIAAATNLVGSTNTLFNVAAGGTAPLSYQWYFNTNTAVLNQTNALLTLNNIQLTNAGYYRCTITNSAGSTNSANALLTVWQPPVITNQPVALTNNVGTTASFSVTAGGTPAPTYQWYFNTNTLLAGQTAATLTLNNIQLTNAGMYSVIVTNSAGGSNSFFAPLTVWQPPVITNHPAAITNNVGTTATFTVTAGGTPAPAYQWYFNTNTLLAGQTAATLTLNNVQLTNAGIYSVIVTNSAGGSNSIFARLTVWQPPVITNHPAGFTTVAGGSATFSVTAGGTPAPGFQWKFNTNTVLAGATGATLSLANVRASQAGTYSVTVANSAGATNSFFATLTVTNPLPPVMSNTVSGGGGKFSFTFTTVAGLTNTVLTNGVLGGTNWGVFTNLPPQGAVPVTLTNPPGGGNLFFKLMIQP